MKSYNHYIQTLCRFVYL